MISLQPLGDPEAVSCEGGVCALPEVTAAEIADDAPEPTDVATDRPADQGTAEAPPTST